MNSSEKRVVIYTHTKNCRYCVATKNFFVFNEIEYEERPIKGNTEYKEQHTALGSPTVPIIVIDGEMVVGNNTSEFRRLLGL